MIRRMEEGEGDIRERVEKMLKELGAEVEVE